MYLYLGHDKVINSKEVIGIFDLDSTSVSKDTKAYLYLKQKEGRIIEVSSDIPRSFVVCEINSDVKVYLSQISPATLKKRADL